MHPQQGKKSITVFAKEIEELAPNANSQNTNTRRKEMWKTRSTYTEDRIEGIVSTLIVGKYSMRKPNKTKADINRRKCPNFPPHYTPHEPHKCPAHGKTCAACKQRNHFAGSPACKSTTVRAFTEAEEEISYTYEDQTVSPTDIVEVGWIHITQHDNTLSLHINGSQQ